MGGIISKNGGPNERRRSSFGSGLSLAHKRKSTATLAKTNATDDKNFRTLVYMKRRLSDTTLESILHSPIVTMEFRKFLHGEFGEQKLNFWLATHNYSKLCETGSVIDMKIQAEEIFNKYVHDNSPIYLDVGLDAVTRQQLSEDLGIQVHEGDNGVDHCKVTCSDMEVLRKVFKFASMKVFQDIKFSYLPIFVTSDNFASLRGESGFFKDKADAENKAADLLTDMGIEYILNKALGLHYFMSFLSEEKVSLKDDFDGVQLCNLYLEILHFSNEMRPLERFWRLERIVARYNGEKVTPALMKVIQEVTANPNDFKTVRPDFLGNVKKEIEEIFEPHLATFKEHSLFHQMSVEVSSSSVVDFNKGSSFKRSCKATIASMDEFARLRNIGQDSNINPDITLQMVLANSQGLCFFKRFVVENFMEDSILFWIKVEKFKDNVEDLPDDSTSDKIRELGKSIVEQFIEVGSRMQVNISNKMRERTLAMFNSEEVDMGVFDEAQEEVFKLLENNLWQKFRGHERFKYLKERFRERGFIRQTQGHVGQFRIGAGSSSSTGIAASSQRRSSVGIA